MLPSMGDDRVELKCHDPYGSCFRPAAVRRCSICRVDIDSGKPVVTTELFLLKKIAVTDSIMSNRLDFGVLCFEKQSQYRYEESE